MTEAQRDAVLGACRSLLASSHFAFRYDWAKVIPGDMEGVYAWTGANGAAGLLQASQGEHKWTNCSFCFYQEDYCCHLAFAKLGNVCKGLIF